jgi:putative SOS response-associated peptidase YedK
MCQRYILPQQAAAENEFMPGRAWWKFAAKYNVAAQQYVPSIRWHDGQSEGAMVRWGLIPSWAEGKPTGEPAIRVDLDQVDRSDVYRIPWLNGQRCLLPSAGFYAWQLTLAKYRQPYFVSLRDRPVFAFAGIWERSVTEDDDVIESCSLICLPANPLLSELSNTERRMPAIVSPEDYGTWLRGTPVEAKAVLRPCPPEAMRAHKISPRINSTVPDDPGLIRPVA